MNAPIEKDALLDMPGEREPPPYFAGRSAEIGAYGRKLHRMCAAGHTTSGLQLTVGVPGLGKTQLAREFAERTRKTNEGGRTVDVLVIPPEDLSDPVSLFLTMAAEIGAEQEAAAVAQIDDRISNVTGGALTATAGVARDVGRHTAAFSRLLRTSKQRGMWDGKALVLIIDELQRIDDDGMKPLCVLHDGNHGCPILLMGFGLQHTAMTLANRSTERSISRIAEPTALEPLDNVDTREAFANGLARMGHGEVPSDSLAKLVEASHGFPQHIHGYLEGAHLALRKNGHLTGASLEDALRHGHERRVAYYDDRLSMGRSHRPMLAVAAAMEATGTDTISHHEAEKAVIAAGFESADVERAIARGSLAYDRKGNVSFGIPSFRSHMARLLASEREAERQRS